MELRGGACESRPPGRIRCVQRDHLVKVDALIQIVDRHVRRRPKAAVDGRDEAVRRRARALVLGDLGARGDGDLEEDDLADVLGVLLEQLLECEDLVRDL